MVAILVDLMRKGTVSRPRISDVVIPKQDFAVGLGFHSRSLTGSVTSMNVDFNTVVVL